ncbi:uncharacterized protein EDB93DRAFT_1303272 [Suillus bovinus]|uniref:uncharacterized protein n=1 Tax=Suillus bovinus TaxID=48563 RepID=UPI001B885685|nr:uncharacterized protein EDB93DRAFT_1303272 [Suillus bovinus]KAG2136520.1 hypothetical protein EDB93DRAFT_1303272 [Suillus bovinus]
MSLQTCPACGRNNFTVTGLSQHLAKSRDSQCQALYRNSRSRTNPNPVCKTTENFAPESGHPKGQHGCVVVPYPDTRAGQRTSQHSPGQSANVTYGAQLVDDENNENIYYPFASKIEWEIARWAKLRGSSSTAFTDLLSIDWSDEHLGLSFKNANELNKLIDHELPTGRPKFKREQVVSLYGDPDFARYLTFALEQHYADDDKTGKWWWETQKKLDAHCPGGTIVPIIISSDKTQVMMFSNKTAYPVYLTIGNIPKELQRKPSSGSHILLAYLPTSHLEHITNKASQCRAIANLYHACLRHVLAPLKFAGSEGISMRSGDGAMSFVGDYPEQLLTTGVKFGECPKCDVEAKDTGSNTTPFHLRKLREVLDALAAFDDGNLAFVHACAAAGIKPIIHPFWEDLPFANIFRAITPDVLHQLYQGLIKHLLGWLSLACGGAEIDARCQQLPPNHHIHLFTKGITCLSRVSGTEHAQICCFILGIIINIRLPNNLDAGRLLQAVRGLLDFLYLVQYPCHSSETLHSLDEALDLFHENKDIFIQPGIRNNFNLPKLHAARHYHLMITLFGTTDNYNTEYTERLHIDLAKDAYRATNHKDEFEKVLRHQKYVSWCLADGHQFEPYHSRPPDMTFRREQVMTKHPTAKAVSIQKLVEDYGATHFREALAHYIDRALDQLAGDIHFPFHRLPVFHKIKWCSIDTGGLNKEHVTLDSVHAKPQQKLGSRLIHRRSDTVFICLGEDSVTNDLEGFGVGQVRVIFSLPPKSLQLLFPPTVNIPPHLAYIEWFTPFPSAPDRNNGLYKLSRLMRGGDRVASIVPVGDIVRSIHLIPKFGDSAPREWTSETVLEDCNTFWVNSYIDRHTFSIFR